MDLNNPFFYTLNALVLVVVGWFLRRFLKERGKIICKIARFKIDFQTYKDKWGEHKECKLEEAETGFYEIHLDFFSEKENQIAVKKPSVVFVIENGKKTKIPISASQHDEFEHENVKGGFNLPPRKLIRINWMGHIENRIMNDLERIIKKSTKAYFRGFLPNGKEIKITILKTPLYKFLSKHFPESLEIDTHDT